VFLVLRNTWKLGCRIADADGQRNGDHEHPDTMPTKFQSKDAFEIFLRQEIEVVLKVISVT